MSYIPESREQPAAPALEPVPRAVDRLHMHVHGAKAAIIAARSTVNHSAKVRNQQCRKCGLGHYHDYPLRGRIALQQSMSRQSSE